MGMLDAELGILGDVPVKTPDDVRHRVETVRESAGDPEVAHSLEDSLYRATLRAIADGTASDPQRMAAAALEASNVVFGRWYA